MRLSQKDVLGALLKNHKITLAELCRKAEVSYNAVYKRAAKGTLLRLGMAETGRLCLALGIAMEDFRALLERAASGAFADDYPREEIVLKRAVYLPGERLIPSMLTPEEADVIKSMREAQEKSIEQALKFRGIM